MNGEGHHHTELVQGYDTESPEVTPLWEPHCECGWVGRQVTSRAAASEDADEHAIQMARADA